MGIPCVWTVFKLLHLLITLVIAFLIFPRFPVLSGSFSFIITRYRTDNHKWILKISLWSTAWDTNLYTLTLSPISLFYHCASNYTRRNISLLVNIKTKMFGSHSRNAITNKRVPLIYDINSYNLFTTDSQNTLFILAYVSKTGSNT